MSSAGEKDIWFKSIVLDSSQLVVLSWCSFLRSPSPKKILQYPHLTPMWVKMKVFELDRINHRYTENCATEIKKKLIFYFVHLYLLFIRHCRETTGNDKQGVKCNLETLQTKFKLSFTVRLHFTVIIQDQLDPGQSWWNISNIISNIQSYFRIRFRAWLGT